MTQKIHPIALFRLSVLGPLTNHDHFERGELKQTLNELASRTYAIPNSRRCYLSEKTIESWYYNWKQGGIDALAPRPRFDKGLSKIASDVQEILVKAKQDNAKRSLDELIRLLETQGEVKKGELKRSSVHRLLKQHGISCPVDNGSQPIERRSFVAEYASDIWYGDVMHGPKTLINGRLRKAYLVTLMDDASRLVLHSAFCPGETALDIEGVLKQAFLKRGLPKKLVIDNGAAYRAGSFQGICARLSVPLVYCRPYEPQAKGKLERWHRVVRQQFLSELTSKHLHDLNSLNTALWAWVEKVYHTREHSVLKCSPLVRWQKDLDQMRTLGPYAHDLDELFYHRDTRKVRKNGTVSFNGRFFEVDYMLSGRKIQLVSDPHTNQVVSVESLDGKPLGHATLLDEQGNNHRHRQRAKRIEETAKAKTQGALNAIEQVCNTAPSTFPQSKE